MTFGSLFLLGAIGALLLFVLTHLRPLSASEINQLASKRRKRAVGAYFAFEQSRATVDLSFKKSMNADGALHRVSEPLPSFPAIAAALLKSKKHEWIVFGFEVNKNVGLVWLNKGPDRNSVAPLLHDDSIAGLALSENACAVLRFHNHPNAVLLPSEQDLLSAGHFAQLLNPKGINFLDFVCGRGYFKEYYRSSSDAFFPVGQYAETAKAANGISKWQNLKLHLERF